MSSTEESQASNVAKSKYYCRYCLQGINQKAKVCHHCSRHQNRLIQYSDRIGLLALIIMVAVAFSQLKEAREERIAASNAVVKAEQAEERTRVLSNEMKKTAVEIAGNVYVSFPWMRNALKEIDVFHYGYASSGIKQI